MDVAFNLLLIAHLGAFAVGITTTIAMPVIMARMPKAPPEARPLFGGIGARLSLNARIAFVVLLLTGIAMVYLRYGGVDGLSPWFWAKMALVAVVLVAIVLSLVIPPGRLDPRLMGWITRLSMAGIVISAVFAFR